MLITKRTERIHHPTEAGAWFEVRVPLSTGDLAAMRTDGKTVGMSLDIMPSVIQAWSYPAPVNAENVNRLDIDTFQWLNREIQRLSGITSDDDPEKKDSSSPSPVTTEPAGEPSPLSSGIS